ncbi:DUF2934 domain-containing protein [Bradyrhizobium japonicum]|uniref:DUF2934 domain-containing protein n=1 Tax=Bradyrhizobium japonicum TaxID=375 RepID=UPI001BAD168B|nr:DUF2934 domain-containing protein [Bradyrhizobium japonicum]MBR0916480.1 DUF2934 domain-containing protein [Bradyrhizobium japonicum]
MSTEQQIREYAHLLWEKAGKPEGKDKEFWEAAEIELSTQNKEAQTQDIKLE